MKMAHDKPAVLAAMRRGAEDSRPEGRAPEPRHGTDADTRKLVHELEVHQIELKMQNEELRRSQAEVMASAARYRTLFNSMDQGYCIVEMISDASGGCPDYRFLEVNSAFARTTGLTDVHGRLASELLPRLEADWYEIFGRVAVGGERTRLEKWSSQFQRWFDVFACRYGDPQDRQVAVLFSDITERKRIEAELQHATGELAGAYRRLADIQETERSTLNRQLHDLVSQNLSAIGLDLGYIAAEMSDDTRAKIMMRLTRAQTLLAFVTRQVRDLMAELQPPMLQEYGLYSALQWWAQQVSRRGALEVIMSGADPRLRLATAVELGLFRIAQEAMVNALKHAAAQRITLTFAVHGSVARLSIEDDGTGFDSDAPRAIDMPFGWGLLGMHQRVEAFGGRLVIDSAPGAGTRIVAEVPLP